jgi:hypothetical protein
MEDIKSLVREFIILNTKILSEHSDSISSKLLKEEAAIRAQAFNYLQEKGLIL